MTKFRRQFHVLEQVTTIAANVSSSFKDRILRVGFKYKFDGPVVAKY